MHRPMITAAAIALWYSFVPGVQQVPRAQGGGGALPMPALHHIHLNSVNPEASVAWYRQYWPKGQATTFAGLPAFLDGIYLVYTKVAKQAPGGFDRKAERSVPQSAFWTFGSTFSGPNTNAARERFDKLDRRQFAYVPIYGGPDGKQTALHALDLPMGDALLTPTAMRERAAKEKESPRPAPTAALDFFYFVDPDGMLVEVTAGKSDSFWNHTHMWHERPLCAANWYADNLGFQIPANANPNTTQQLKDGRWDPCDVPVGEVSFPTFMRMGQLRIPIGTVRFANGTFPAYPRQCRNGRCGPGNDQPLTRSRSQVIDHLGFTYPNLDAVIAHLKSRKILILEGPYKLGDTRAILIEDLDGLALELIEAK